MFTSIIDLIKFMVNKQDLFINYQYIFDNILMDKDVTKKVLSDIEKIFINYLNYVSNKEDFKCNDEIVRILSDLDIKKITNYISIIEEEVSKLEFNLNYKLWLDCFFAKLIGG